MDELLSVGLFAQEGTPAWATILVAAVTGLFGFVSGAGAAAIVTTSHERREKFRDRMVEAAEAFLQMALDSAGQLSRVEHAAKRLASVSPEDDVQRDRLAKDVTTRFEKQLATGDETYHRLGRLYVVFRGERVGDCAAEMYTALSEWRTALIGLNQPPADAERTNPEALVTLQKAVGSARDQYMREVNKAIRRRWRL